MMRAAILEKFGPIEQVRIGTLPTPVPGPGEVLVEVQAAPVNYVDLVVVTGQYQMPPSLPFVPGKGPAGRIVALGAGVTGLAVGDPVLAMAEQGGYAQRVAVPADQCYVLPVGLGFVDAAAMSLAYDTAWFALRERARIQAGETALILGASGAVGLAAVQLAKAMGARVLAAVSRPERGAAALEAGADGIVDLSVPNLHDGLRDQVRSLTGGALADVVLDPLGGDVFAAALRAVAWCGRLVVIGFAAGSIPTLKINYLLVKNIEVSGLQISDYRKRRPARVAEGFAEIFALFTAGLVRPPPSITLPLDRAVEGLALVRDRTAGSRRIILLPHETGSEA